MSSTFMTASKLVYTSESVTEGHPDKMCDQISDAVLDAIYRDDPYGRVACETATTTGLIMVFGEITTSTYVEMQDVVRQVVEDIGYTRAKFGFDYSTCGVIVSIKRQSPDIDMGVEMSARGRADGLFEVDLKLSVRATSKESPLFQVELVYGGVFQVAATEEQIEPMLLIECPRYLFPFARQIIATCTSDGGFYPPFLLEPLDFAAVYAARKQQEGASAGNAQSRA